MMIFGLPGGRLGFRVFFEGDGSGGGSGGDDPGKGGGGEDAGKAGDPVPVDFDAFLKSQPEAVRAAYDAHTKGLKSALDKEREAREAAEKARKEALKTEDEARLKALENEKKFEELAAERGKQLETVAGELDALKKQLEGTSGTVSQYEEKLKALLDAKKKAVKLPDYIAPLLEGKSPLEQLEWLEANSEKISGGKPAGLGGSPDNSNGGVSDEEAAKLAAHTW